MKTEQNDPSQTNGSGSAADQQAAETSGQQAASKPPENPSDGRTEAQSPPQPVTPGKTQEVHSLKQAAQPEHKPSADGGSAPNGANGCALAGGGAPQPPHKAARSKPPKKKKKASNQDNHVSFRCQDEEMDIVEQRMESTGENQSDAVRFMIREYGSKSGIVCLAPKTPPDQLEDLLGILGKWRKDFVKAQPRLNIPTPKTDDERYEQVKEWRKESKRLLREIPDICRALLGVLEVMTSLTPERIALFQQFIPAIQKWQTGAAAKRDEKMERFCIALLELLGDLGIKPNA